MKNTYQIGDLYTSTKNAITGIITEIEIVRSDLVRIRLNVSGVDRWTTWTPNN
jgi:hypothetical protein